MKPEQINLDLGLFWIESEWRRICGGAEWNGEWMGARLGRDDAVDGANWATTIPDGGERERRIYTMRAREPEELHEPEIGI